MSMRIWPLQVDVTPTIHSDLPTKPSSRPLDLTGFFYARRYDVTLCITLWATLLRSETKPKPNCPVPQSGARAPSPRNCAHSPVPPHGPPGLCQAHGARFRQLHVTGHVCSWRKERSWPSPQVDARTRRNGCSQATLPLNTEHLTWRLT